MSQGTNALKTILVAAAVLLAGVGLGQIMSLDTTARPTAEAPAAGNQAIPLRSDGSSILADVAERVGPAVVFIRTERTVEVDRRADTPWDFFREYFDREDQRGRRYHGEGGGSGFVFDNEGRIFTNHHVVRDADRITVLLGGEEYDAELVGADPLTDIAIVKIDPPKGVPTVSLGDSDVLRVGDWVMAIGTPFGQLQGSVTAGIVSAMGRNDLRIAGGSAIYQNYIQTDASINFGNSGGPLVNMSGQAIGINTAINPSGQGIGFAIPINMARRVMTQLIERGSVAYGYMGIGLQALDRDLAQGRGLDLENGILVTQVLDGTPASKAGLRQGDVIVVFNGDAVEQEHEFRMRVANTPPGTTIPMTVVRGEKELDLDIRIGERPERVVVAQEEPGDAWLGLQVDDATKRDYRRQYNLSRGQQGVVVVGVEAGSPAESAGIREGDVITEVYTHEVTSLEDYVAVSEKLRERKDPIAFLVKRARTTTYVTVDPTER